MYKIVKTSFKMNPLERAIQIISGGNVSQFARIVSDECLLLDITCRPKRLSQQVVNLWLKNERPPSPQYVKVISKLTGNTVKEEQLRPDVFYSYKNKAA